ncbi:beta-ketoacyl-[acyl-carrier-protein] synthase family protein [Streptomyces sp. NPDC056257]|uniref:beta-ketoacyl-[acyl-carrier-protein] synthase family protein n=1 Tax=Streptomyces sp. NPDC056257 TaxID=3345765 RepID=UPI0035E2565C
MVTGVGALTPIGTTVGEFWDAAVRGTVGTGPITLCDVTDFPHRMGGEVKGFGDARSALPRSTQLAVAASLAAAADAGVRPWTSDPARAGVCMGTLLGNRAAVEAGVMRFHRGEPSADMDGLDSAPPLVDLADAVSRELGFMGPSSVVSSACASGNSALAYAADTIRANRADLMIAGGVDEMSSALLMLFTSLRSLAPDVARPFDRNRAGLLVAEGSAALVLESYEHARRRGAPIYAELSGWSSASDAYHMTAPHPEGRGARRSMERALAQAGVPVDQVDYISAHGTGTASNDRVEARAIRDVFGARTPAVSSLKGALGHAQGAASAIEAVACVLAIRDGVIPPTANLADVDPECAMDLVSVEAREARVDVAVNNAFGFGGNTGCTVFTRFGSRRAR